MEPKRLWLRVLAVASAVVLAGAYVYDQAGGNLLSRWRPGDAPSAPGNIHGTVMPGWKSRGDFTPGDPRAVMGGSKSAAVFVPSEPPTVMSGSKSKVFSLAPRPAPFAGTPVSEPAERITTAAEDPFADVRP